MAQAKRHAGGLRPDKYLSREQVERLMRYVRKEADQARARGSWRAVVNEMIIETLLFSGLRAAELCGLQIRDLPCFHNKNIIYVRTGKGSVSRSVEIPGHFAQRLSDFVKGYRKNAKPVSPLFVCEAGYRKLNWTEHRRSKADGHLIVRERTEHTARLSYASLYSKVHSIGIKAGLVRLHPHMLRHTYGTMLYNIDRDVRLVGNQLGHLNIGTTQIYTRTDNASARRQIELLNF